MEFRILGPLEVVRDGRTLDLGGARQRALVAALLLDANEVVSSDALVERLWGVRGRPAGKATLQVYISRLRKLLGRDVVVTTPPGYVLLVEPGELDLHRFEELVADARTADAESAATLLREALALWRGRPLADLAYESFAQTDVTRLEELRLAALEERIDVDLALGRHALLVGELEKLARAHPYRERIRGQLMLALYRSGRQAEALEAYRDGRRLLAEELGLEPNESLKALEKAILAHDPSVEIGVGSTRRGDASRSILVVVPDEPRLDALLSLARPLACATPAREILLSRIARAGELPAATEWLRRVRTDLAAEGIPARAAAFSSATPGEDLAALASRHDTDLLLLLEAGAADLDGDARAVLEHACCDVAVLVDRGGAIRAGPIVVPFGAARHDWAALELGARIASSMRVPLRLIGAAWDGRGEARDASRLLADASLIVQRLADVVAEPVLASPGRQGVRALAEGAGVLVVGLSERWRREGLGRMRADLAQAPPAPTVFVRGGVRPGGLAPVETRTRFTWSLTSAGVP